jgi:hypothetical protein
MTMFYVDWINRALDVFETTDHAAVRVSISGYSCHEENLIVIHVGKLLTDILHEVQI